LKEQFADREVFIENFKAKLSYPPDEALPVLMHYGMAGSGKTWLARYLMWEVCPQAGFDTKERGFPCVYILGAF